MQITYEAKALTIAQCADHEPDADLLPVIRAVNEMDTYSAERGWIVIGNATVTVDFFDKAEIKSQQMDALKAQLQTVRAENQQRENAILDQISKLQALTFESD